MFQKEGVLHVDKQEEVQSQKMKFQLAPCQNTGKTPDNQKVDGTSAGTFSGFRRVEYRHNHERSSEGNMPSVPEFFDWNGDCKGN